MGDAKEWMGNLLAVVGVFALGYWLAAGRSVHASGDDLQFQLESVGDASSLMVYDPSSKTVYVYRGAMVGNSALQCNFRFQLNKPGGVVRRENCPAQTLQ